MTKIFVFGSNTEGRHSKGAALEALRRYGAVYGQAYGRQGNSYAIVTKDLKKKGEISLMNISWQIANLCVYAAQHPKLSFEVTKIGCGLAGFKEEDIVPMFKDAPENLHLPSDWKEYR